MRSTVTRETAELSSRWWFTLRVRPAPPHRHTPRKATASRRVTARTCALFNFTVYNFAVRLPALCAQPCLALGENSIGRVKHTRLRVPMHTSRALRTKTPLEDIGTNCGGGGGIPIVPRAAFPMEEARKNVSSKPYNISSIELLVETIYTI